MYLIIFWLSLGIIPNTFAFTAYDCSIPNYKVAKIPHVLDQCGQNKLKTNTSFEYIQILQRPENFPAKVYQCKVNIVRRIYDCKSNSNIISTMSYLENITPETCLKIQETGNYEYIPNNNIINIKPNFSTKGSVNLAGLISADGICHGSTYNYGMESWDNVVVIADITVSIQDYVTTVYSHTAKIMLNYGETYNFLDRSYDDMVHGLTIWEAENNADYDKYKVLYEGEAEKAIVISKEHQTIFYNVQMNGSLFVISLERETSPNVWQTEHTSLIIIASQNTKNFFKSSMLTIDMNLLAYPFGKFVYIEKYTKTPSLYVNLVHQKCESKQPKLQAQLTLARDYPDDFGHSYTRQPGYTAFVRGEVINFKQKI